MISSKPVPSLTDDELRKEWRDFQKLAIERPDDEAAPRVLELAREVIRRERNGARIHPL